MQKAVRGQKGSGIISIRLFGCVQKILAEKIGGIKVVKDIISGEVTDLSKLRKTIAALREMGFPIESVSGEGYRLAETSDTLSEAGIVMELKTESLATQKSLTIFS